MPPASTRGLARGRGAALLLAFDDEPYGHLVDGKFNRDEIAAHEAWVAVHPRPVLHSHFTRCLVTSGSGLISLTPATLDLLAANDAKITATSHEATAETSPHHRGLLALFLGPVLDALRGERCEVTPGGDLTWRRSLASFQEQWAFRLLVSASFRDAPMPEEED